jgi:C-terminal processing protease CtpA/Prc
VPLQPEADAFRGNLYVLTNGASFSSTGHLCSLLRFHGLATFIGEETGGTFTCTDGSTDILLPETHLVLRSSTKEFRTAVTGLTAGKGIVPDYEIVPTIQDVIEGRDAQMELAIRLADGNPP